MLLLHGTDDMCALVSNAVQFKKALQEAGAQVRCQSLSFYCPFSTQYTEAQYTEALYTEALYSLPGVINGQPPRASVL